MSTIENNKLIAEFMLNKIVPQSWTWEYHKSWDALMPVVEKIESIEDSNLPYLSYSQNNFCVSIRNGFCEIISGDFLMDFDEFSRHSGTKIEATYNAVVEFIKWYNEQGGKDE